MSFDELDLYDDLDDFQQAEEAKSKELQSWEAKCSAAQVEIANLHVQCKALEKKIKTMEVNFQNLLDTAKAEIKRKDTLITQLRKEKDDLCFRRKRGTKFEQPESKPQNDTTDQEHKRFKKDDIEAIKTEFVPEVCHKSDKRREENRQDKQKSTRNEHVGRKHETNHIDYKRDKQQSADATSSRHRSTDGRRTHDRERDRNRRRSRSRDRERCRSRERNGERSSSHRSQVNNKEKSRRSRSRSRSNHKGSKKFSNRTNSQERDEKLNTKSVTHEKRIQQDTMEALFGNTPKPNSPAEQPNSSNSSVDSAKVLKKLKANAEPFTPEELYTPENLIKAEANLANDVDTEIRQDLTADVESYFVSNAVEQIEQVLKADIQEGVETAEHIPGLDLIRNEQTVDEQTHMLQYNSVAIDNVDLNLNKPVVEDTETEKQTKIKLELEALKIENENTIGCKSFEETEIFTNIEHAAHETVVEIEPKIPQSISNNEVEQIIQDISDIEKKDALEKYAKENVSNFVITQSGETLSTCLNFAVNSANIVEEDAEQVENENTISKREDIQIIEDIRLPVMMDIEHIVLQVDIHNQIQSKPDTVPTQNIALTETEHTVETLLNVQQGQGMSHVPEQLTQMNSVQETTYTAVSVLPTQVAHLLGQATNVKESNINPQVEDIDATLISKQTVMYAQPDSTKIDHNDNDVAQKAVTIELLPAKLIAKDIKESYQSLNLETDTIELELEQLHQHTHSEVQPDETVVTSTSMKIAQTPKKDLISILTQSPLQQTAAKVASHSPPKTKIRAKKTGARTASEKTTPKSESASDTTPERREKTPLKKRKLNLTEKHEHAVEVPQTPPGSGISMITSPLDVTINETLNSSSQEQNQSFGSDSSIVTKRCSLGNSDYQFERINDEVILRVTRRGRRRQPAAPIENSST